METLLPVAAVILFGSLVQGYAGFGFGLITVPLLTFFLSPSLVVPLVALCGQIVNTILYIQMRGKADRTAVIPLLAGALIGLAPGLSLFHYADERVIRMILSFLLVGYAAYRLFMKRVILSPGTAWGVAAGIASGILGAGMSTNGPPAIIYVTLHDRGKEIVKATLASYFFFAGIIVIVAHAATGATTGAVIDQFLVAIPLVIFGTGLGATLFALSGARSYEKAVYVLILLMGAAIFPWG
ncbi:MAG: sulfite exporter TauE/SafE family protein [Nitrospinae bacterium]|nr:sulfite exporter TauE/SafE family protein [Nitrospinota bacterium]